MARGGGCPAAVAKDIPLREPPPPLPLPPAVPGPRQRKTKTRAEETAADAPPEKPGQKARASRPRCPAAGGLAPPPWSVPSALAAPYASRSSACLPPSRPPYPGHFSLRPPPPDRHQPRFPAAVPAVPAACAPGRAAERGRRDPGPETPAPRQRLDPPPSPGPATSPEGAGAPSGAGSRPGRRRLHSSGGSGGSAAGALLGARAGTREGRGRRGRGRARSVPPAPGASPFAPPPALPTGRTRRLSPEQLTDKGGSGRALSRRRS